MRRVAGTLLGVLLLAPALLSAQAAAPTASTPDDDEFKIHVSAELKANGRWSEDDRFALSFPFPPDFVPVGQPNVALRTVSPGSSLEVSRALVNLDVELPRSISGHVQVGFINLYDRNPTSKDQTVDVREAWVLFGKKRGSLEPLPGSSLYLLVGKAPKLERQPFRRLESYGLVSTAFNRFNDLQLQVGGSLGTRVYFAAQLSNGNPMFMRDPNALAGDNGTDMPPNPDPTLNSGFPILYDAEVEELAGDERFEYGGALGLRFLNTERIARNRRDGLLLPHAAVRGREAARHLLRGRPRHPGRHRRAVAADQRRRARGVRRQPRRALRRLLALRPGREAEGGRAAAARHRGGGGLSVPARAISPTRATSSPRSSRRSAGARSTTTSGRRAASWRRASPGTGASSTSGSASRSSAGST